MYPSAEDTRMLDFFAEYLSNGLPEASAGLDPTEKEIYGDAVKLPDSANLN